MPAIRIICLPGKPISQIESRVENGSKMLSAMIASYAQYRDNHTPSTFKSLKASIMEG